MSRTQEGTGAPRATVRGPRFVPRELSCQRAVRLLFLLWFAFFIGGRAFHQKFGEIYPGFFMPVFAGTGLEHMTATTGELDCTYVTVIFRDGTAREVSLQRLGGDDLIPSLLAELLFRDTRAIGPALPSGEFRATVSPGTRHYLKERIQALFPHQVPSSVRLQCWRESVALDDPQDRKLLRQKSDYLISLDHETD